MTSRWRVPAADDFPAKLWAAIEASADGLPHFAERGLIERTPSQRWRRAGLARVSEEST